MSEYNANPNPGAPNPGAPNPGAENEIPVFDPEDIAKNKTMAGLAYIIFFLPLVTDANSPFGRFHANQGLLLLLAAIGVGLVSAILAFTIIVPIIGFIAHIAIMVFAIIGLIDGLNGRAKFVPLIGKLKIIK